MRPALVMLALAVAAGACQRKQREVEVAATGADPAPADAAPAARPFPRVPAADITGLRIELAGRPAVVLRRDGPAWRIVEPIRAAADPRAVAFALREIERLEWDPAPVATGRDAWGDLAVTDAEVVTLRVVAGMPLPPLHAGPRRHGRVGDDPAVWRLHHLDHFTFARELRLWTDRMVVQLPPAQIAGIELVDARGRRRPAGDDARVLVQELEAHEQVSVSPAAAGLDRPRLTVVIDRGTPPQLEIMIGARESRTTYVRVAGDERIWAVDNAIADRLSAAKNLSTGFKSPRR